MSKKEIRFKGKVELGQAISHLEDIVACLKKGHVRLQNGKRGVSLEPDGLVEVLISANRKGDRETLLVEVAWQKPKVQKRDLNLTILSEEPAAAVAVE